MKTFFRSRVRGAASAAMVAVLVSWQMPALRADVVFAWNEALQQATARAGPVRPHLEARAYALAHLAMDEAVVSVADLRATPEERLSAQRAAAMVAAHDVLVDLLPAARALFETLAQQHGAAIPEGKAKEHGREAGARAAAAVLQRRANDGWTRLTWFEPTGPDRSMGQAAALARGDAPVPSPWLEAKPFGLKSVTQFAVTELRTMRANGDTIATAALQRAKLFHGLDRASALAAYEGAGRGTPVAWWNRVARQLGSERGLDLPAQARLLAAINAVLADATLAGLHWRHEVGSWRLTTVGVWKMMENPLPSDPSGRIDDPYRSEVVDRKVLVPPVSDFPSLVATVAGAAQAGLREWFGTDDIEFASPLGTAEPAATSDGGGARRYANISAAAREAAFVASLDGVHLRESCVAGYMLGNSIGTFIGKRHRGLRR